MRYIFDLVLVFFAGLFFIKGDNNYSLWSEIFQLLFHLQNPFPMPVIIVVPAIAASIFIHPIFGFLLFIIIILQTKLAIWLYCIQHL